MAFQKGDRIEVASKKEGYRGSYYEGTVVEELGETEFIVQYKNLVKDDFSGPLLEVVSGDELCLVPSSIPVKGFRTGDIVDAFAKDGWWVGMICGKIKDKYVVYFDLYPEFKYVYPLSRLRVHQDCGTWISYYYN